MIFVSFFIKSKLKFGIFFDNLVSNRIAYFKIFAFLSLYDFSTNSFITYFNDSVTFKLNDWQDNNCLNSGLENYNKIIVALELNAFKYL